MRAFIALPIPDLVRRSIWEALAPLRSVAPGVAWVRPEHLHITLFFLGELDASGVERAVELFADPSLSRLPFVVSFQGLGAFPPRGAPRVIYAGLVAGAQECRAYHDQLAPRVARLAELDRRPYNPHVTLGRVKHSGGRIDLSAHAAVHGSYGVDRCVLFESILSREGPEYREVARIEFRRG